MNIKYQTAALVPPPYAHAIELELNTDKTGDLNYRFDLEYLDREILADHEIFDEGFTLNDDLNFTGKLGEIWVNELENILDKTKSVQKMELEDHEDFWEIQIENGSPFYPKNHIFWLSFLEEIRQAILEDQKIEKSFELTLVENKDGKNQNTVYRASFKDKSFIRLKDKNQQSLKWSELNKLFRDFYSGDFNYEKSTSKLSDKNGVFLNFGDSQWFELGKSYSNNPKKIKAWL